MAKSQFPVLFIVSGVALVATSFVWPYVVGGRRAWSEQDAEQYEQARIDLHSLRGQFGAMLQNSPSASESSKTIEAASNRGNMVNRSGTLDRSKLSELSDRIAQVEERYRGLETKLSRAQSDGVATAQLIRWIGVAVFAVGVLGFYAARFFGSA